MENQPLPTPTNQLLKIAEIATLLHVPIKTVYWWVNRREIPFLKVGKHLRFDVGKVLGFFSEKTEIRAQEACVKLGSPLQSPDRWSLKTRTRTIARPERQ